MAFYVTYDSQGNLAGFYSDAVNDAIPEEAIAIGYDVYRTWTADQTRYHVSLPDRVVEQRPDWIPFAEIRDAPLSLDEAKQKLKQIIVDEAIRRHSILLVGYSQAEALTWDRKEQEARTFLQTQDLDDAKNLQIEAAIRMSAKTPEEIMAATTLLANIVVGKAEAMLSFSFKTAGYRDRLQESVNTLTSLEEVNNFDYLSGWPEVQPF